ncbi:MAG: hypothetical protein PHQ43_15795 [Dehalococcoidales bacterium]|nr:hypothetical protein [Dehalococcoidales bacterium]
MKESRLQKKILDYLNSLEYCVAYKIIQANERGVPDIMAVLRGHPMFFEVKVNSPLSAVQRYQADRLMRAGATVHIVYSVQEVQEIAEGRIDLLGKP